MSNMSSKNKLQFNYIQDFMKDLDLTDEEWTFIRNVEVSGPLKDIHQTMIAFRTAKINEKTAKTT